MKKQIVSVCAAVASFVAVASTVESSNIFGVLKVPTGAGYGTNTEVIVGVPWLAVGSGEVNVAPTNLVATTGLTDGDWLFYYNPSDKNFYSWQLSSGSWAAATTVEKVTTITPTGSEVVARGNALVVITTNSYVYLNGQYTSTAVSAQTIATGTQATDYTYTLLAPPTTSDYNVNDATWTNVNAGDWIVTGLDTIYTRNADNTAWQKKNGKDGNGFTEYTTDGVTITAGRGAWYIRYGNGEAPTVKW